MYKTLALAAFTLALVMCLAWYDWRLFATLIVFGAGMNLENKEEK